MVTKSATVFVEIRWDGSKERIRLDIGWLRRNHGQRIDTEEFWQGEKKPILYRPRANYRQGQRGTHIVELQYLQAQHRHLLDEDEILWGRAVVVLSPSLSTASAHWTTIPEDTRFDGPAKCLVKRERPSAIKKQLAKVRIAQAEFKKELLKRRNCCELTGEPLRAVLDAAHVHDVENGGCDEPENGLLLRADLHRLFDKGYFSIRADGRLSLHPKLSPAYAHELRACRLTAETLRRITPYLHERRDRSPKE